jgi:hypothetical protein
MFVGGNSGYKPKDYQLGVEEYRILNSVRNDDVIVLTKYPNPNSHFLRNGLEGRKMIDFIQNLGKEGAIFAYVGQPNTPHKVAKNYLSLYISHESYDQLSDQTQKFYCYHFDSLLTQHRQYIALKGSSDLKFSKYLIDPL